MKTVLLAGPALALLASTAPAQTCTFSTGPDVIVGDLTSPANYSSLGSLEALALGTTSCNIGNTVLNWIASNPNHPVIGQNLYRLKDRGGWWAFEQVGMSWLKHGFAALQGNVCCTNCMPADSAHLGRGCSDPYGGSLNGSQASLGPRWQVNAHTGGFPYPPANPAWSGSTARRLQVEIADLEATGSTTTRYFGEGHYVTPDDAAAGNQNNNASWREMAVTGSGSAWSFSYIGSTQRQMQAIRAWQAVQPSVSIIDLTYDGDGLVLLASDVTDLGSGTWHYEYAVYNMNAHECVRSIEIEVPPGVNVTNVGFHDVVYRDGDGQGNVSQDGTDWPGQRLASSVEWHTDTILQNANANAIRWGTTYNFRFDADTPPTGGTVTLGSFRSGLLKGVAAEVPSAAAQAGVSYCDGSDGALALCPCGNPGLPDTGCDNAQGTGGVRILAASFLPDGGGGGTATLAGEGFPVGTTPSVTLIRSSQRENPPAVFGDGLRCVSVVGLVRIGAGLAAGGLISLPVSHGAGAGTFDYQLWYRNQPDSFCDPLAGFNLSNGLELVW
jgi:hypothetical protein